MSTDNIDSRKEWQIDYDAKEVEQLKVRLPKGLRGELQFHVIQEASKDKTNPKYSKWNGASWKPSVNALINYLIREELGSKD